MGDQWSSQQWLEKIEPRIKNGPVEHVVDMPSGPSVDTLWTVWLSAHSSMTRPGVKHVTISSQVMSGDLIYHPATKCTDALHTQNVHHLQMLYKKPGFLITYPRVGVPRRLKAHVWEEMSHAYLLAGSGTLWKFCKLLCFPTADYEIADFCRFQTFPTVWNDFSIRLWRGWKMLADVFEAVWSARSPRPMIGRAEWRCLTCCRGGLTQGY